MYSKVNETEPKWKAMVLHIRRQVTLGMVIGSCAFFSPAPWQDSRTETLTHLDRLSIKALILPSEATANSAVQSIPDAKL